MDPHAVLGVRPGAPPDEIRSAYRRLAAELHPDRNPGDQVVATRFRKVSEAYSAIMSGRTEAPRPARPDLATDPIEAIGDAVVGLVDIIFGGGQARERSTEPVREVVRLSMREALLGVTRELEVRWFESCDRCAGVGREGQEGLCTECGGRGRVGVNMGLVRIVATCKTCAGTGSRTGTCRACGGVALSPRTERVLVAVPAGVRDGTRLSYRGRGRPDGRGGRSDLCIEIRTEG